MTSAFGARLADSFGRAGQLCVGIDPHPYLLTEWGLPVDASGAREFGLRLVDAAAGRAAVVKPQVAFYERYGSAGFVALEAVLAAARDTDLLVIGDAKRGDIGTTMDSYGDAWLDDSSPLRVDAVTVATYQGLGANTGFLAKARATGRGVFVLAATSNPEAHLTQTARLASGATVAAGIVDDVLSDNQAAGSDTLGSVGLVLGATLDLGEYGIDLGRLTTTPILAPGFGAQGALYSDVARLYGPAAGAVLVSASRSIAQGGPAGVAAAIDEANREVASCLA
ncbi:orotidine-5'-phosphate decarboxylase [Frondihabitans australicus]|uniref:Orotidine-5'-phosphate decarboxylase n=1 Tax=Frondihabitans australicus TaxID=386892 RepID=A0A495IEP4_9MICO|nr:orotidine-5'-phosphate decarboxylase [Frondihabitans australicus]RKR74110.1 orotidine-5'-phosphate decarboxylase [Frondihabitans australicus]